ncbi:hypothetical protein HYU06_05265 [Candidatus Woesearchaeota archaeon]|nr:hypothetical protein [Candidatus Woesearchaeota archaeon]
MANVGVVVDIEDVEDAVGYGVVANSVGYGASEVWSVHRFILKLLLFINMANTIKDNDGYPIFQDSKSRERCHRWRFRRELNEKTGLHLSKTEFDNLGFEVHHIDNNKENYKEIGNLALVTKEGHKAIHERSWFYENISLATKIIFPLLLFANLMYFLTNNKTYFYSYIFISIIGLLLPYTPKSLRKYLFKEGFLVKNSNN